jgi:heme-degrading monooxygenase HmoA
MSVIVVGKLTVNPDNIEKLFTERADVFMAVSAEAKKCGAIHHLFMRGEGDAVLILDEWPTADDFHSFFSSQPQIAELMAEAGVAGPPEFTIYEVMDSPDRI